MTRLRTFTKPERFISCPACTQGSHQVSHLSGGVTFGPWYCDECGIGFTGHILSDEEVEVELSKERKIRTLVTLRLEADDAPVTLLVEGMRFVCGSDDGSEDENHDAYFYDEHTCPTNYFPDVLKVIGPDGDEDPHGIFRYVKTEPWVETAL